MGGGDADDETLRAGEGEALAEAPELRLCDGEGAAEAERAPDPLSRGEELAEAHPLPVAEGATPVAVAATEASGDAVSALDGVMATEAVGVALTPPLSVAVAL